MNKMIAVIGLMSLGFSAQAQVIGRIDPETREFFIPVDQKIEYRVFGYQFASPGTQKMICFSSHSGDVAANYNNCPLGSYYDTGKLRPGEKIIYLGPYGKFGKMSFVGANGKKTIFYLPRSCYALK
jgi:hypothetical protein